MEAKSMNSFEDREKSFEKKFRKIIKSKNKNNILDPFNYYS